MLHVTNGDQTVGLLRRSGLPGDNLAWRDVLHEGPVPGGLSSGELRDLRAAFIAGQGWASLDDVRREFAARDARLAAAVDQEEVVLWFEHDLFDQLQLIQVIDAIAGIPGVVQRASIISIDHYPGVDPFHGFGQLRPGDLVSLFPQRVPLSPEQVALAREIWGAVRSSDPRRLARLVGQELAPLPFLRAALVRLLEQFPSSQDGLSGTERHILDGASTGAMPPLHLFTIDQAREPAPFMGDTVFWTHLAALCNEPSPFLVPTREQTKGRPLSFDRDFAGTELSLTELGRAVLAGEVDRVSAAGIDRWIGGVHLEGHAVAWRWDSKRQQLAGRTPS